VTSSERALRGERAPVVVSVVVVSVVVVVVFDIVNSNLP
jgi:hypothetical protein